MSERTLPRPPQVTFSGWVILVGSMVVLTTIYDTVANLRSIDTREQVQEMLSEPPLSGTNVTLERMLDLMHGASLVAGGCAAAMVILGAFVLRRHEQARIVVTVLAVPLFVSGLLVGGFATSLVAVAAMLLWTRPARDWFAGRAPQAPEREASPAGAWPHRPVTPPAAESGRASETESTAKLPQPTVGHDTEQHDGDGPRPWSGYGAPQLPGRPAGARRPREIISACILTWVFAGMALASTLTVLAVVPGDDSLLRELYEQEEQFAESDISMSMLKTSVLVLSGGMALWALIAIVVAVFAYLRHNWARWVLFASCVSTAVFSLVLAIGAPMMLVLTGASIYAAILLTRPSLTAWYAAQGGGTTPPQ